jgi:hypothetical protein
MSADIESTLERLRNHFDVQSDAELARALKVGHSTISTWKARGRVPDRVMRILEGQSPLALGVGPVYWGPHENAAFGLALVRFCRLHGDTVKSSEFRTSYELATRSSDFWSLFSQAQSDLRDELERSKDGKAEAGLAFILNDEVSNPERACAKARNTIKEGRSQVTFSDGNATTL